LFLFATCSFLSLFLVESVDARTDESFLKIKTDDDDFSTREGALKLTKAGHVNEYRVLRGHDKKQKNYLDYARCVRLLGRSSGIFHLVERFRTQLSQQELEPTHTAVLRVVLGARRDVGARG